jgi:hypothetical protein
MMSDKMALKAAIDLMHVPSQVRLLRSEPLPDGVLALLRIAAGDAEAESAAALAIDRPQEFVRQAATFFIEQILFAPNSDSYRVLGASPQASAGELRRNVALLLRWLHPDLDSASERSIFVGRVTAAWNDLKTPDRRSAYDNLLRHSADGNKAARSAGKSRSGRHRNGKLFRTNGGSRQSGLRRTAKLRRSASGIGFFRRALSVLLNRPLQ